MTLKKYKHLCVPDHWQHYWTRYPHGYTILEALINWVSQVNEMTDDLNDIKKDLDKFYEKFDKNLRAEVEKMLRDFEKDGTLDYLINEVIFGRLQQSKAPTNPIYKKSVFMEIPVVFPDYQNIVSEYDFRNIWASAFTIDWESRELFLIMLGATKPSGVYDDRIITVYDIDTMAYKGYFWAGVYGGEGIVVKRENGRRILYLQTEDFHLGMYDITDLPEKGQKLEPFQRVYVGVHWNFATDGNKWLITQRGAELGYKATRKVHAYYDNNFNRLGFITTDFADFGYYDSELYSSNTKAQAMDIGNGKIYLGIGAYLMTGTNGKQGAQGIRVLSSNGRLLEEGLIDGQKMIDFLNAKGHNAEIVENEGIHVAPDGSVYSLTVIRTPDHPDASTGGIIIWREFSPEQDAYNFSGIATTVPQERNRKYQPASLTTLDGKIYMENEVTGERLTDMKKIINYMYDLSRHEFAFYSTTVDVDWFDGVKIGGAKYIEIKNLNNRYFLVVENGYISRSPSTYWVERVDSTTFKVDRVLQEGTATTYLEPYTDIRTLERGLYEVIQSKAENPYLADTFPDSDALCVVEIKGSSTRQKIELFITATEQRFVMFNHTGTFTPMKEI